MTEKLFKVRGQKSRSLRGEMHFSGIDLLSSVRCPCGGGCIDGTTY